MQEPSTKASPAPLPLEALWKKWMPGQTREWPDRAGYEELATELLEELRKTGEAFIEKAAVENRWPHRHVLKADLERILPDRVPSPPSFPGHPSPPSGSNGVNMHCAFGHTMFSINNFFPEAGDQLMSDDGERYVEVITVLPRRSARETMIEYEVVSASGRTASRPVSLASLGKSYVLEWREAWKGFTPKEVGHHKVEPQAATGT